MKSKPQPKLENIESKLYRLWTNRSDRETFLASRPGDKMAEGVAASEHDFVAEIDREGVKLYSSLIEIGRMDLMSSIYPVMEELLGKQFRGLVFDYFECMPPDHYNLNRAASRFSQYVSGLEKLISKYPFLPELADYEWIELAVMEDAKEDNPYQPPVTGGAVDPELFASTTPVLNSVYIARRYSYPIPDLVDQINEGKKLPRRIKPEATCVIVYRDPDSLDAELLSVDEISLALLETIETNPTITYGQLIKDLCSKDPGNSSSLLIGCLGAIEQLRELKLIVSERPGLPEPSAASSSAKKESAVATNSAKRKPSATTDSQEREPAKAGAAKSRRSQ